MKKLLLLISVTLFTVNVWGQNNFPTEANSTVKIDGGDIKFIRPETTGGWARGLSFYNTDETTLFSSFGLYGSADTPVRFYLAHGDSPWDSGLGMYILTNGNVGIGTTIPATKLDVLGQDIQFFSGTTTNTLKIGRNENEHFKFYVNDSHGYIDYMQDLDNNENHIFYIRNMGLGTGINDIRFQTSSLTRLIISTGGNIGIGTTSPSRKLDVFGKAVFGESDKTTLHGATIGFSRNNANYIWAESTGGYLVFGVNGDLNAVQNSAMHIDAAKTTRFYGNVGIGISGMSIPSGYKLAVDGKIICEEVKVEISENWADFVFEPEYELISLKELDNFIQENKHLPEIPTTEEVEENGISVGEMNARLLQKIEELTLYVIELKKENEEQSEEIKELKKLIK